MGKINQSLYFARLHSDSAKSLDDGNGQPQFFRQQQQCFLEASAECLFRAINFLAIDLLAKGPLRTELMQRPNSLLTSLKSAYQEAPSPEVNSLIQALEDSHSLASLLSARQAIWSHNAVRPTLAKDAIAVVDLSLSVDSCEHWQQVITDILFKVQGTSAEF